MNRWPGARRKTRCDYCLAAPALWLWWRTHIPYRGPYRISGNVPMNAATCVEHAGSPAWQGLLALHGEGRIERAEGR